MLGIPLDIVGYAGGGILLASWRLNTYLRRRYKGAEYKVEITRRTPDEEHRWLVAVEGPNSAKRRKVDIWPRLSARWMIFWMARYDRALQRAEKRKREKRERKTYTVRR